MTNHVNRHFYLERKKSPISSWRGHWLRSYNICSVLPTQTLEQNILWGCVCLPTFDSLTFTEGNHTAACFQDGHFKVEQGHGQLWINDHDISSKAMNHWLQAFFCWWIYQPHKEMSTQISQMLPCPPYIERGYTSIYLITRASFQSYYF